MIGHEHTKVLLQVCNFAYIPLRCQSREWQRIWLPKDSRQRKVYGFMVVVDKGHLAPTATTTNFAKLSEAVVEVAVTSVDDAGVVSCIHVVVTAFTIGKKAGWVAEVVYTDLYSVFSMCIQAATLPRKFGHALLEEEPYSCIIYMIRTVL